MIVKWVKKLTLDIDTLHTHTYVYKYLSHI